jgi:hypothetical protein
MRRRLAIPPISSNRFGHKYQYRHAAPSYASAQRWRNKNRYPAVQWMNYDVLSRGRCLQSKNATDGGVPFGCRDVHARCITLFASLWIKPAQARPR